MSLEEENNNIINYSTDNRDWYITDDKFQRYWLWHGLIKSKETLKNSPNFIVNRKQVVYLQRQIIISYFKNFFLFPLYVLRLLTPWYLKGKNNVWENLKRLVKGKEFKPLRFAIFSQTLFVIFLVLLSLFFFFRNPDTSKATALFADAVDYSTGTNPYSVVSADFDGDGNDDLAVTNQGSNTVSVFINNSDGTFATKVDYGTGTTPTMVKAADLDGDTYPDLALVNEGGNLSILINNGDGTFAAKVDYTAGTTPYALVIIDLNGDTNKDIAVANQGTNNISVFINNGDGTFAGSQSYGADSGPYSIAAGDLNGDTYPDLVTANQNSTTISVLLNNGNGTFAKASNSTAGSSPYAVVMDTFNSDSYFDLAVSTGDNTVALFMGNGDGTFATKVDYNVDAVPYNLSSGDLDNDGDKDLAVGYYGQNYIATLLNNGDGTFSTATNYLTGSESVSIAISDLDNDGDKDLAVSNYTSTTLSVLLNQTIPPNSAPTISTSTLTVTTSTDGSGNIGISATVDDANINDLNISYYYDTSTTTCALVATTTMSSSISATFGSPIVNNSNPTGQVTGVITDAGANTVDAIWDSKTDLPDANAEYCISVYAYDGSVTSTIATTTVILDNVAPPVQDFTSLTAASSSVSLVWESPADPNDLGAFTVSSTAGGEITTSSLSAIYETLTPNTLYYFQLKLSDDYGNNGGFSTSTSIYTNAAPPINFSATAMSSDTISLAWESNNNPSGTVYEIYNTVARSVVGSTTSTSYDVTGLTAETSYTFKVRAVYFSNSFAYAYSDQDSATTLAVSAPATPVVSSFSNFSSTGFDFSWEATTNTSYYIVSSTASSETATTSDTNYSLSNLTPNTAYTVQVKAHDGNSQTSDYSVVTSTYTNAATPLNVQGSTNGQTSILLTWSSNSNPEDTVYEIFNYTTSAVVATTTGNSYYVGGLSANNSYQFKVRAQSKRDATVYSQYASSPAINTLNYSDTITLTLEVAKPGTGFKFASRPDSHTAALNSITGGVASLEFHTNVVEIGLGEGQSQNIDLSGDGHSDTTVAMNSVGDSQATLTLYNIQQSGGGGVFVKFPKIREGATKAILINNGDLITTDRKVKLDFFVEDAELMSISNSEDFSGISFENYDDSKYWSLTEGVGKKTIFVRFRSKEGGTITYSASIDLQTKKVNDVDSVIENTNCSLKIHGAYRTKDNPRVYYITDDCQKRAFKNPTIYFLFFNSWKSVNYIDNKVLNSVKDAQTNFMTLDNSFVLKENYLVKSLDNPKVYVIVDSKKHHIVNQDVFNRLGFQWTKLLYVDKDLLDKYPTGDDIK